MLVDIGLEFLLSLIPIPGYDLEVKVTDLELSYKSKKFLHLSLYSYIIKTLCWISFILLLIGLGDRVISMESIRPSIRLCLSINALLCTP